MAATLARFDQSPVRNKSARWGAVATAARNANADLFQEGERLAAVCGRGRFSDPRLADVARRHGLAYALAEGYLQKGPEILELLAGTFALAILDRTAGRAFLAIDRLGSSSLCYSVEDGKLVFGSTLDAIGEFPGASKELSRQAIHDYVYFHMVPGPLTVYANRRRLLPGTFVIWDGGKVKTTSYWEMRFIENERQSTQQLTERFRRLLKTSVSDAMQEGAQNGAFLSGGTDSTTVAGMLREVTGEAPRTYSIGFDAAGFDEMGYARIAARHFGTRHREYYVTPDDVVGAIPRIAAVHDQPFGNSSAVPTYYCAKLARDDGVDTLLGGDGGDELFGGNERYAKQYRYSLYSDLPAALRKGIIEPFASVLPAAGITGKVQRYIATASMEMPARYDNYNLVTRFGPENIFTAEFLEDVDPALPAAEVADKYRGAHAQSLINHMLALDLKYTLADNDLPKVIRSCELAGVGATFPLLNDDLVAFSARLPPELKLRGTKLRYFFKQALRDFLPGEIIRKTKHGFGLPFGPWVQTHGPLRKRALGSLADLKKRGIVRGDFIDQLTTVHLNSHAGYYGTMVWTLMMLEQWLRHRAIA